jgi:SAM-dependent methyltransferase
MASTQWHEQLLTTRQWLDRRDAAPIRTGSHPAIGSAIVELYLEFLARHRDGAVLDIGCGRGERRRQFRGRYTGIDAIAAPGDASFPLVCGRAEDLPWPDATFDGVLSVEAFDHFAEPRRAAAEALRVLRPGGDLLIFARKGVPDAPAEAAVHLHRFDAGSLTSLFAAGLTRWRLGEDSSYVLLLGRRR